jgi:hypothetical protein
MAAVSEEDGPGGQTVQFVTAAFKKAWISAINARTFPAKS